MVYSYYQNINETTLAETQVVSCDLVDDKSELSNAGIEAAKILGQNVYRVVLADSIIFPEGGGQPDDRGTINEIQTIRSIRKGTEALHYLLVDDATTDKGDCKVVPFAPGQSVKTEIDWQRRFDHMQQHSGTSFYVVPVLSCNSLSAPETPIRPRR
ncbi:unnamed protein product [Orchesella dallaii]|uniref:Uncharacterized protein n=1 Tax=Orchesella dallaii TaxID=48710 RepID=A0ABP1QCK5_9HEXA